MGPTDFFTDAGKALFHTMYPQFLLDGKIEGLEYDLIGRNGFERKVSVTATAVTDALGRFVRSRGLMYDVTEMQRSREQLRQVTLEQGAMLDNDLVGIVKLKGRQIAWINRAMRRIFGYELDELLGQSGRQLHPTDVIYESVSDAAHATLKAGGAFRSQIEIAACRPRVRRRCTEPPVPAEAIAALEAIGPAGLEFHRSRV